jgi:hypothetical protein
VPARRLATLSGISSSAADAGPVAGWRDVADFPRRVEELELAVMRACARSGEWPEKVAVGIRAALDFAAANPEAARVLAIDVRTSGSGTDYLRLVELFSELLGAEAPREPPGVSDASDRAVVGGIATVVAMHLRSGTLDRLPHAAPELTYLALLPYLGFEEAKRWASLAGTT